MVNDGVLLKRAQREIQQLKRQLSTSTQPLIPSQPSTQPSTHSLEREVEWLRSRVGELEVMLEAKSVQLETQHTLSIANQIADTVKRIKEGDESMEQGEGGKVVGDQDAVESEEVKGAGDGIQSPVSDAETPHTPTHTLSDAPAHTQHTPSFVSPLNLKQVRQGDDAGRVGGREVDAKTVDKPDGPGDGCVIGRVLYEFGGDQAGDLPLIVGEYVQVYERDVSGWWRGCDVSGRLGVFPCHFVEIVDASSLPHPLPFTSSEAQSKSPPTPNDNDQPPESDPSTHISPATSMQLNETALAQQPTLHSPPHPSSKSDAKSTPSPSTHPETNSSRHPSPPHSPIHTSTPPSPQAWVDSHPPTPMQPCSPSHTSKSVEEVERQVSSAPLSVDPPPPTYTTPSTAPPSHTSIHSHSSTHTHSTNRSFKDKEKQLRGLAAR